MKKFFLFYLLILSARSAWAAFDYPAFTPRGAALGNSYIASTQTMTAFLINPALSINSPRYYASLNYFQLFNLPELSYASGIVTFSFRQFGMGLAIETFGDKIYRENRLTLNISHRFLENKFAAGIAIHGYFISVKNYDSITAQGVDLGFRYQILPQLWMGGTIENLNQPNLNDHREEIPQRLKIGIQYRHSAQLFIHAALVKDAYLDPRISFGIEYHPSQLLHVFSGYTTSPDLPSGGVGLKISTIEISYALQYHFELGATHFIGIAINPKPK